jgi:tight adherence protein C
MNIFFCIMTALTIFTAIALIATLYLGRRSRATLQRVHEVTYRGREYRRSTPIVNTASRRFFAAVHWLRTHIGLSEAADLAGRLANAGYKGRYPVDIYNTARILGPMVAFCIGIFIPVERYFWMIALPAAAFIAPNIILSRLIKRRREKIRRSIPDTVDLLVICVDAGLGIDQALMRVSHELGITHPQITEELMQINREQRAGKLRIQAWADMAARSQLPDIDAFASMLLQTERFGTPISKALSTFADTIRQKRRQAAEQMAAKTTVKIIFPLVLFIFPSLFIVLLGPAALSIMSTMGAMGK